MSPRLARSLVVSLATLSAPALAWGQLTPGQGGPVTPPGPEEKPEGVAEKAPAPPGTLPTTPVLTTPKTKEKRFEAHELNGNFRFRGDWFKNFNLGFNDDPTLSGAPFRVPLACKPASGQTQTRPCEETLKSANMRLRLEPVIRVPKANATVHMQIDVLDNLVLGSTPDGTFLDGTPSPTNIPISAFSGSQVAPEAGRNYLYDSIRVKRAWAEVTTPLGILKFGRQPSHWGLGILANAGAYDPIHGTYDYDADYGDTADRLLFGTIIPGTEFRAAIAMDWANTQPTSAQTDIFSNRYDGQPWDLDDNDDVNQWIFVISKLDKPEVFNEMVDEGKLALNYGAYVVYRTQKWDSIGTTLGAAPAPENFVPRDATAYIPDLWARLGWGNLELEVEGVAIIGDINELTDQNISEELDVRQFGGVGRLGYRLLDDDLKLQLEVGFASGDQWDNNPQGSTNVRDARALPGPGDTTVNAFRFDFDYKIDLILFRELLGTITNATYVRPSFDYELTDEIVLRGWSVASFAHIPVSTPGNGTMYGVEFDADVGYNSGNFFAGISYGVLFPLGALDHPADDPNQGGPGFGYGTNVGDAQTAQTIQTRLMLAF